MVVFPSWLPFFLYDSSRKTHTQRNNAATKDAKNARNAITQRQRPQRKTQDATHAKSPHIIQNPAFIPQMGSTC